MIFLQPKRKNVPLCLTSVSTQIIFIKYNSIRTKCIDRLKICNDHLEEHNLNCNIVLEPSLATLLFS